MAGVGTTMALVATIISAGLVALAYASGEAGLIIAFVPNAIMLCVALGLLIEIQKKGALSATLITMIIAIVGGSIVSAGAFAVILLGIVFCTGGLAWPVIIGVCYGIGSIFTKDKTTTLSSYAQRARSSGYSDADIRTQLKSDGLDDDQINAVFGS